MGIPDQRELSENKAAHDCLLHLVKMHRELFMVSIPRHRHSSIAISRPRSLRFKARVRRARLMLLPVFFQVSSDMLTQCHFNYMEESIPVALEELGSELKQDWRGYLYACTTALLKEAREKYVHVIIVFILSVKIKRQL